MVTFSFCDRYDNVTETSHTPDLGARFIRRCSRTCSSSAGFQYDFFIHFLGSFILLFLDYESLVTGYSVFFLYLTSDFISSCLVFALAVPKVVSFVLCRFELQPFFYLLLWV